MKYFYTVFFLFIASQFTPAQETTYSKINFSGIKTETIKEIADMGVDVKCGGRFIDGNLEVIVSSHELKLLKAKGLEFSFIHEDLSTLPGETPAQKAKALNELEYDKARSKDQDFSLLNLIESGLQPSACISDNIVTPTNFNLGSLSGNLNYSELMAELNDMRAKYPNLISAPTPISSTLKTAENRDVYMLRISDNPDTDEAGEPEALYTSLHHSREPVSMMQLIYTMWYLLENYGSDPFITNIVNHHELYFIPCVNPDGYNYVSNVDNWWRKNRRNLGGGCVGVDLNRNYSYSWGIGSTSNCSGETYRGPNPFSEAETQMIREFCFNHEFKTAMNAHTSGGLLFHQWADGDPNPPADYDILRRWTHDMTKLNRFNYGDGWLLSPIGGESDDWMYAEDLAQKPKIFAFTPEISPTGGFYPPSSSILPQCKEFVLANLTLAAYTGKYAQIHDYTTANISALNGILTFGLERLGRTDGNYTLTVTPVSSNIVSVSNNVHNFNNPGFLSLNANRVDVNFTLDSKTISNEEVVFKVQLSNGDFTLYDEEITKVFDPMVLFSDDPDTDGLLNWTGNGWELTSDSFSGSSAITESASGNYGNNQSKTLTLINPVNLSSVDSAVLQMYAKWDTERQADFVQVQISDDDKASWTTLCGKYSKPGAPNSRQPQGEPVYEGENFAWVMEEFDLSAYTGSANINTLASGDIFIRLTFASDGSVVEDGFVFDDLSVIGFIDPILQPVELLWFTGEQEHNNVALQWKTASEENNDYFDVEFSTDGINYSSIGNVKGQGTTNVAAVYGFTHKNAALLGYDVLYYRLKQVDFDGTFAYSDIIAVEVSSSLDAAKLFPNPVKRSGKEVELVAHNIRYVEIFDSTGKLMFTRDHTGKNVMLLPTNNLAVGMYLVRINRNETLKLIVH